ncbi:MAG: PIN domain-containing protein [Candidatus Kapabacteria bacterium]|jgi:predicted nucleic acid-binding protein|nr:PIN domain-containing protein [Candidatus Kapabacteria bacterium]
MRVIADTGFLVGYLDKADQYHQWAIKAAQHHKPPFYSCEAVIAEAAYLLGSRVGVQGISRLLDLLEANLVKIDFRIEHHASRIATLLQRYNNVPMDYADSCIVVMAEQEKYREHLILTVDYTDFSIYRRNEREKLTINTPQI